MPAMQQVQVGDLPPITVRELKLGEVRAWALRIDAGLVEFDAVGVGVIPDCQLTDLFEMTTLTPAQADTLAASELNVIADVARKLNPHFFALRASIARTAQMMQAEIRHAISSETPQSS